MPLPKYMSMITFTFPIAFKADMAKTLWKVRELHKLQGVREVEIDASKAVLNVQYAPQQGLSEDLNVVQGALMAITLNREDTL